MKRHGNLYEKIISIENLTLADKKAQKGKSNQYGVIVHNKRKQENLEQLHLLLREGKYKTSFYKKFTIFEPKEREISVLPYYPDRILHHAIMNIVEPIFVNTFTTNTYSCIKNKGIHAAFYDLKSYLRDVPNTLYCLKLDIKKFYPSMDHIILKQLIARKFKDKELLKLFNEIIDSASGVPIGNYLSQFFANYYLTGFDHWLKETKKVKYYLRYADDIVILHPDKKYLHELLYNIKFYLTESLKLSVKDNYQLFPVAARGIDFLGYKFYHTHILLRKSLKKNFARNLKNEKSITSYYGWAVHANTKHLLKKFLGMKKFNELNIKLTTNSFVGDKIKIAKILNKQIIIHDFKVTKSKFNTDECLHLQIELNGNKHVVFTGSKILMNMILKVEKLDFPFVSTIVEENESYLFS
jgi:RNA-directed DNA polymerase